MRRSDPVSLSLWSSGAYRVASFDPDSRRGALVEHDGEHTMRVVGVSGDHFEETVASSLAIRGRMQVRVSTLRGWRDGSLEWRWQVVRRGLRRDETLSIDADGAWRFEQTDERRGRTTTFESTAPGRYEGVTTTRSGELRSTSTWERDESGAMIGSFTGANGEDAGAMRIPDPEQRSAGEPVTWTGPDSRGVIGYDANGRAGTVTVETDGGTTKTTWNDGGG
jgi:hypothetical protein